MSRSSQFGVLLMLFVLGPAAPSAFGLLIGTPTFNLPPSSTMGPITNNTLVVTSIGNGFSVAGQVAVNIPPGPVAGILLNYEVDWPIDPSYVNPSLFVTTMIDGFSAPPVGAVGNTAGVVTSSIVTLPSTVLPPSISTVPLGLVAGVDLPAWSPPIGNNSSTFAFTASAGMVLRQRFELDGNYISGPGGTWIIDLPVLTFVSPIPIIPEPTSALLCLGWVGLLRVHRRRV